MSKDKVENFFNKQAKQISLFLEIEQIIRSIGDVKVEVKKSQISFGTKLKFAWVWLPRKWDSRPKNSIVLSFGVSRHLENKQIVQAVEPYPGRWTHHIIIQNKTDLNNNVYKWLHEAYAFSLNRK